MSGTIRAFVFDMDGLMLDTERVAAMSFDYAGEKCGIGRAGYITERILGLSADDARPVWLAEFGGAYDEDKMNEYRREFYEMYWRDHDVPVKPGLYELLDFLDGRGYALAVASSTERERVTRHLRSARVLDRFDAVICGDMVKRSKPDPQIYETACAALGFEPRECCALEDARSGVISAHAAGCRVIMVPDLWTPDEAERRLVYAVCRDLYEVRELAARDGF